MNCRLCGGLTALQGERPDIALVRCRTCGFVSGHPRIEAEATERYRHYYRGEAPPAPEYRYEQWLSVAERRVGCGRLLEVGAGRGAFVRVALRRGWSVVANEVSEAGLSDLRNTGAEVVTGRVEEANLPQAHFDFVVSLEVLEHLPDPLGHLRELGRITRPNGLLLLTTPNFDGLSRRWMGIRWRVVDPEHLGYFTPRTLGSALRKSGFTRARVTSRSLDISTWRRPAAASPRAAASFDPQASARLRDAIQERPVLRFARDTLNRVLGLARLGDSLLVWAVR